MSPDRAGAAAATARLREEIAGDRDAMARRVADLGDADGRLARAPGDTAALALMAWAVHGWYTALESIMERVARELDATVPAGDKWHRALLAQATADVPGVRPALLPRELRADLEELLAARHFLRHAYGTELDPDRLAHNAARIRAVDRPVREAMERFDAYLVKAIDEAVKGASA
jgi:hypothetical protein